MSCPQPLQDFIGDKREPVSTLETLLVLRRAPAFPTSSPQVSHASFSSSEFSNDATIYVWWLKQALA